jgi:hypothetical protein
MRLKKKAEQKGKKRDFQVEGQRRRRTRPRLNDAKWQCLFDPSLNKGCTAEAPILREEIVPYFLPLALVALFPEQWWRIAA